MRFFTMLLFLPALAFGASFDATVTWTTTSTNHDGSNVYRDGVKIGSVAKGVTSYLDVGLAESTTYCYQIGDYNAFPSEVKGAQTCATTGVVLVPVNGAPSGPMIIYQGKP